MNKMSFEMSNCIEAVEPMVLELTKLAKVNLTKDSILRFEICINEALNNTIEHAIFANRESPINLVLTTDTKTVTLEIFDPEGAPPFDLREYAADLSTIDVMSESGRGLGLILQCTDILDYGPLEGRNRLSLGFESNETN